MLKKIATALTMLALLGAPVLAQAAASTQTTTPSKDGRNKRLLQRLGGSTAVVNEISDNLAWSDLVSRGAEYKILFDGGAAKEYAHYKNDGQYGAFSGTAQHVNLAHTGVYKLLVSLGVTGTIIPAMEATGLDITEDASAAANDAVELVGGILGASGRPMVIGEDPEFEFCVDAKITDVDGSDFFAIGLREVEAFAAAHTTYTDFAAIGSVSGDIKITTDLADAGEVTTDTTDDWGDLAQKELCVRVTSAGVVTYTIAGVAPTTTAAYTFADGLLVVPFVYLLQDTNIAEDTHLISWSLLFR